MGTRLLDQAPMFAFRLGLVWLLSCAVAGAAALVPVPGRGDLPSVWYLEPNGGQAKPDVLFLHRGTPSLAVTAQSVLYSPLGVRLNLVASNSNPTVSFTDSLPGAVNIFTGSDARKWVTGIARYTKANLTEVYPGIDVQYEADSDGRMTMRLLLRAGVDPAVVRFEMPESVNAAISPAGPLVLRLGPSRDDPQLFFPVPIVFQGDKPGRIDLTANWTVQSSTRFGLDVQAPDPTLPLTIEIKLTDDGRYPLPAIGPNPVVDAAGNTYFATTVRDAAGKDVPFPDRPEVRAGCGTAIVTAVPCMDVAVYKFSKAGELIFISYFGGRTQEAAGFMGLASDGALVLAGSTDSSDFPVNSTTAIQAAYAGPPAVPGGGYPTVSGDFFAARLDPASGVLLAATYLGGPGADSMGEAALGPDGSLYFMPKWIGTFSAGMLVTSGAVLRSCLSDPCLNGYAAHLSPLLDKLLYGTYLPGVVQATAHLHSDGSIYYGGRSGPGFSPTPTAYQKQPAGGDDGIVVRLDPTGSKLLFATYLGGPDTDWILRMAVAPDGSVWVAVSSFVQCCVNISNRLVRLDANGERILAEKPYDVGDLAVEAAGNLIATAPGNFAVGPDAFLANSCAGTVAYLKLSPAGEQLFATYLPANSNTDFDGVSASGLPALVIGGARFEVVEGRSMGTFAGCIVDGAAFGNPDRIAPGEIVTLFGSGLGPREGVGFQLVDGRVPVSLGGTQVLVNGEPVPILFSSYWQVNAILPYSLPLATRPKIQVVSSGGAGNELSTSYVQESGISLFQADAAKPIPAAAALNEDGTVNSRGNPAKPGSRVVLFGTGGGATIPVSVAGEVTPLSPRPLAAGVRAQIANGPLVSVEYAGAAPGLVAGVTQINIKLPAVIPDTPGLAPGTVPLLVFSGAGGPYPAQVTVAVAPK
jgi:uncharacterized protein (TIGR03437 family)